jgi:hypothetical protein
VCWKLIHHHAYRTRPLLTSSKPCNRFHQIRPLNVHTTAPPFRKAADDFVSLKCDMFHDNSNNTKYLHYIHRLANINTPFAATKPLCTAATHQTYHILQTSLPSLPKRLLYRPDMRTERTDDAGRIELLPTEGDGFGSLTAAKSPSQTYRSLITSYKKSQALRFSWSLVDVAHGKLSTGEPASLIVTRFSFEGRKAARRFKSASINYVFLPEDSFSDGPVVEDISPSGEWLMIPPDTSASTDVDDLSGSFSKAALSEPVPFPALSQPRLTRRDSFDSISSIRTIRIPWVFADLENPKIIQGQPTLTGLTRCLGHEGSGDNTARWVLRENTSTKRGIPTVFQTAVLLRRSNNANFIATVAIQAEIDLAHAISTAFKNTAGLVPRDDPIRFRVDANTLTDENILDNWDHLDYVDLREYMMVASTKRSE